MLVTIFEGKIKIRHYFRKFDQKWVYILSLENNIITSECKFSAKTKEKALKKLYKYGLVHFFQTLEDNQ